MNTLKERQHELNDIMSDIDCPNGFECCSSGFDNLCKVKINKVDEFIECLEDTSDSCPFALPCEEKNLCLCPVRIYIAKKFKR